MRRTEIFIQTVSTYIQKNLYWIVLLPMLLDQFKQKCQRGMKLYISFIYHLNNEELTICVEVYSYKKSKFT